MTMSARHVVFALVGWLAISYLVVDGKTTGPQLAEMSDGVIHRAYEFRQHFIPREVSKPKKPKKDEDTEPPEPKVHFSQPLPPPLPTVQRNDMDSTDSDYNSGSFDTGTPNIFSSSSSSEMAVVPAYHNRELMSAPTAIANVLADLCPHGMLPIAFGMAAAGGTGPVLATVVLLVFGALSYYSLVSFARAADAVLVQAEENHEAGESLSAVWERTLPNGKMTRYIPDLGCVGLTIGCLLFYSAFIGDLFGSLVSGVNSLPDFLKKRWTVLLLLHTVPILPLCLKKDLSALKYSSVIGLFGILYTIAFVAKRLVDGSYSMGGRFFELMPEAMRPAASHLFPHKEGSGILGYVNDLPALYSGRGLLVLMNMCCVAYACHYNAVKYYMELRDRTLPTLKGVMTAGIGGTATVFWLMMILGYATFGSNAQALILNNYHSSKDPLATIARAFTGVAIISGYALMFSGLKAALFSLLELDRPDVEDKDAKQKTLSVLVLAIIAISACFVTEHELGTVIGIVGSIFGTVVIYMFPALVNNNLLKMRDDSGNFIAKPFFRNEHLFNNALVIFGIIFAILGTWISLTNG